MASILTYVPGAVAARSGRWTYHADAVIPFYRSRYVTDPLSRSMEVRHLSGHSQKG